MANKLSTFDPRFVKFLSPHSFSAKSQILATAPKHSVCLTDQLPLRCFVSLNHNKCRLFSGCFQRSPSRTKRDVDWALIPHGSSTVPLPEALEVKSFIHDHTVCPRSILPAFPSILKPFWLCSSLGGVFRPL